MRIAFAAEILIRDAATINEVVSNGAGARSVRVPSRRTGASRFAAEGPFSAPPERVTALVQALADVRMRSVHAVNVL